MCGPPVFSFDLEKKGKHQKSGRTRVRQDTYWSA